MNFQKLCGIGFILLTIRCGDILILQSLKRIHCQQMRCIYRLTSKSDRIRRVQFKVGKKMDIVASTIWQREQERPYVLEFLGIQERADFSETELESKLIDHLQDFLLELGTGFAFVARQKRFTFEEDHFRVDLVFYNRLLQCFVLFDLKTEKLKHQDLGQMQMYVNYYDRFEKKDFENPTIGILLCPQKNDAVVELTLPENSNIFASQYQLYLPDKKLLQAKLQEWLDEETGGEDD